MRWASFLAIALLGFGVRMQQLGARPMHTDEAVNAYIVGQMLAGKPFPYDPVDRHGPALAALAVPLVRAQGAYSFAQLTEAELRLTPVLAGTMTLLLFGFAAELFGFIPCAVAAALTAIAPLPVYYDRYFIHESLLAGASFSLLLTTWCAWCRRSVPHAVLAGASAAVMLACKETAILHFAALLAAMVFVHFAGARTPLQLPNRIVLASAFGAFLLFAVAFYSRVGQDFTAIAALPHSLPHVLARATGEGHQKPIWYYLQLLASGWSGAVLCGLAAAGCISTIRRGGASPPLFLTIYALALGGLYSLIPYKTPWLALNLWVPLSLLAGLALQWLYRQATRMRSPRFVLSWMALAGMAVGTAVAHDTRNRVFLHPADEDNPYAYAHTSEDLLDLPAAIDRLAQERGIASPRIAVIAADPWPLPWYLRAYPQTGFWQPGQDAGPADFYITSTEAAERYQEQLHAMRPEFFGVRPGVLILVWSLEVD